MKQLKSYLPGLALTVVLAALSVILGNSLSLIGSSVFAIVLGILVNNIFSPGENFQAGISYSSKKILQYSIIILGFTMSIGQVSQTGFSSLKISITTILISFLVSYIVGRWLKMSKNLEILIGFGTAIVVVRPLLRLHLFWKLTMMKLPSQCQRFFFLIFWLFFSFQVWDI